uniref:Uncharacterized protein n=1 Tax=Anopheles atroparvus TaxID=41427 RepID=A0AAG5DDS2_ANOAO
MCGFSRTPHPTSGIIVTARSGIVSVRMAIVAGSRGGAARLEDRTCAVGEKRRQIAMRCDTIRRLSCHHHAARDEDGNKTLRTGERRDLWERRNGESKIDEEFN